MALFNANFPPGAHTAARKSSLKRCGLLVSLALVAGSGRRPVAVSFVAASVTGVTWSGKRFRGVMDMMSETWDDISEFASECAAQVPKEWNDFSSDVSQWFQRFKISAKESEWYAGAKERASAAAVAMRDATTQRTVKKANAEATNLVATSEVTLKSMSIAVTWKWERLRSTLRLPPAQRLKERPEALWRTYRDEAGMLRVKKDVEFSRLRELMELRAPHGFGGRDGGDPATKRLKLEHAWKLGNPGTWGKYEANRADVRGEMKILLQKKTAAQRQKKTAARSRAARKKQLHVRKEFAAVTKKHLPGLDNSVNEVYLVHGTTPNNVLKIIDGGFNEHFAKDTGLFGAGVYFADDVSKNDHYTGGSVADTMFQGDRTRGRRDLYDLHDRLFAGDHRRCEKGRLYYIFVVRVLIGHFQKTNAHRNYKRDADPIPNVSSETLFHSVVVQGDRGHRHNEYIQYHADRCYPEYLMAYRRVH